jgi:type IV secretory pathway TrbF-like protein
MRKQARLNDHIGREIDGSSPYALAHSVWQDRHGSYATLARQAKVWAVVGTIALCAASYALVSVISQRDFVPFMVQTDQLIPQRALAGASVSNFPDGVVRRELATFVERLRSIPADRDVLRRDVARLISFLRNSSPADRKVREYFEDQATSPNTFVGKVMRWVDVTSVVYKGGDSWVIEWTETVERLGAGAEPVVGLFQATLVVGEGVPQDKDALASNPFGLFVQDYSITYIGAK